MLLLFQVGISYAQDTWGQYPVLDTNLDNAPSISACGRKETYTVTVKRGGTACINGTLRVTLPEHFEYLSNSVTATNGGSASFQSYDASTRQLLINVNIPAATIGDSADIKLSFDAIAKCGAIALANLPQEQKPRMIYALQGCTQASGGVGQAINVLYAVLNLEVTPNISTVLLGNTFTRTIKITNNGNGAIQSFKLSVDLPANLSVVSANPTVAGWNVVYNNDEYLFSGGNLAIGQSVEFTQSLQASSCDIGEATYQTFYGCDPDAVCDFVDMISTKRHPSVVVSTDFKPTLTVTAKDLQGASLCFNNEVYHVYTIKNIGNALATDVRMRIHLPTVLHTIFLTTWYKIHWNIL